MPRTAVIFGASGAQGSAVCKLLDAKGWHLIMAARNADRLEDAASELENAQTVQADATKPDEVARVFETAREVGEVSAVANFAGSVYLKPAHLTSDHDWAETIALNLDSAFFVLREAVKEMKRARTQGSIVLMSSAASQIGLSNHEAIAAAKGGVAALARSAAATYASAGIRVNAVAPGLVESGMTERLVKNEGSRKTSERMHPLGRIGQADDIASIVVYLLEAESGWITGQTFTVDGGRSSIKMVG